MMTREDMLRELELLPVWQLRTQLPEKMLPKVADLSLALAEPILEKSQSLTYISSENGDWLFVMADITSDEETELLNNIFKAMRISPKPAQTHLNLIQVLENSQPKVIVTMGEVATQALLQLHEPLEKLRGKLHAICKSKLVPTYDLKHLLQHLPDKAKAWHDLRVAMQAMQEV